MFQLTFICNYGLDFCHQNQNRSVLRFKGYRARTLWVLSLLLGVDSPEKQEFFSLYTHPGFETHISPMKNDLLFPFERSIQKFLKVSKSPIERFHFFFAVQWQTIRLDMPESFFSVDRFPSWRSIPEVYLLHFFVKLPMDEVSLKISLQKNWEASFWLLLEPWLVKIGKKAFDRDF